MKVTEMEILGLRLYNGYGVNRLRLTTGIQVCVNAARTTTKDRG